MGAPKAIAACCICVGLTACGPSNQVKPVDVAFNMSEHTAFTRPGNSSIRGQAFLRQNGGGVVTCAGSKVILFPDTPYFQAVLKVAKSGAKPDVSGKSEEIKKLGRETMCDAQGNFEFKGLPAAKWNLGTQVTWFVQTTQGGDLLKTIETKSGEETKVLLTDADLAR